MTKQRWIINLDPLNIHNYTELYVKKIQVLQKIAAWQPLIQNMCGLLSCCIVGKVVYFTGSCGAIKVKVIYRCRIHRVTGNLE